MGKFQSAANAQKKVKLVVYGEPGTGKTLLALSFPRVAFVDMEGSADLYTPDREIAGWGKIAPYDVLRTKSLNDLLAAVDEIRKDGGKTWGTLVIDPATVLNQVLQDAGQMRAEARAARYNKSADEATMSDADWGVVKRRTYALMTDLVNLPVHVILTAHLREVYETQRIAGKEERVKVGVKPDAEKKTTYWADFVFEMRTAGGKYVAVCKKERGGYFKVEQVVDGLRYDHFLSFVKGHSAGQSVSQVVETDAARQTMTLLDQDDQSDEHTSGNKTEKGTGAVVPNTPDALLSLVNRRVTVPYDNAAHLFNALRAESGNGKWNWPRDPAGWQAALDMAVAHANKKMQPAHDAA